MTTLSIPNRPFATEMITGLMLPDGIFTTIFGVQNINIHLTNAGAGAATATVYLESVSHPSIVVTGSTQSIYGLSGGAARVMAWAADFTNCPAGEHLVSFVVESGGTTSRIIKKIFVTRVTFDAPSVTFRAETPQGMLVAQFSDFIRPKNRCGCGGKRRHKCGCRTPQRPKRDPVKSINEFAKLFQGHDPDFEFCPPGYLPSRVKCALIPTPAFEGQYGDLPFEDPWWKVILCILAVALLIAAAIESDGGVTVTTGNGGGGGGGGGDDENCCPVGAQGGSQSYVVAGLVAGAAAALTIAGMTDTRDPFRRGQDNTVPGAGEFTTAESLDATFKYLEPISTGTPFAVGLDWKYQRVTTGGTYSYSASDVQQNEHVLSGYEIDAPEVAYRHKRDENWIIKARFTDPGGTLLKGSQLFVQCFLVGPQGEWRQIQMQDDGLSPDEKASDGTYTGLYSFLREPSEGLWRYFVIAQDVNNARTDMTPEEAAQIIGGMVLTNQLVITFDDDECPVVPDGHVMVI